MSQTRQQFFASIRVTTLWTMLSRVLGLVRDMVVAALLGLVTGGVADALVIAMSVPNLFRQLFGEGALTAAFLPLMARRLETNRAAAWRLASVVFTWLAIGLSGLVLLIEALFGAAWLIWGDDPSLTLLLWLTSITLPYMVLICLAAQINAVLNALGRFGIGAAMPAAMNLVLIAGALAAPWLAADPVTQATIVAASVLLGGLVQLGALWPALRSLGFRFEYQPGEHWGEIRTIAITMLPMVLGLAATQINVLLDRLIAFGFSGPADDPGGIAWLGGIAYPMQQGATAAVYYGERLYQLPIGILGVAVATVVFPRLARHAARGSNMQLRADLTLGLRLVTFFALPASVGLFLLAEPLAKLLFQRGRFTPDDAARTARLIAIFGLGVWAYCANPTLIRGFYALGRHAAAVRISLFSVGLNIVLNLALIWPMAEGGLALATAISAAVQSIVLAVGLKRLGAGVMLRPLADTAARSAAATVAMGVCCYGTLHWLRSTSSEGLQTTFLSWTSSIMTERVRERLLPNPEVLLLVSVPLFVSIAAYLGVAMLLRCSELRLVWGPAGERTGATSPR